MGKVKGQKRRYTREDMHAADGTRDPKNRMRRKGQQETDCSYWLPVPSLRVLDRLK